jgi:hypothetical protein
VREPYPSGHLCNLASRRLQLTKQIKGRMVVGPPANVFRLDTQPHAGGRNALKQCNQLGGPILALGARMSDALKPMVDTRLALDSVHSVC